jgi:hypothetical protein
MSAATLRRATPLTLLLAALLPAGCREAPEPVAVRGGVVAVEMRDYRFDPEFIRTSDRRIRIQVRNRGRLPHALRLRLRGRERLSIPTVLPGSSRSVTARLEPGSYRMACPIGNHEELGMYGVLVVR